MSGAVEDKLMAGLKYDVLNGDSFERNTFGTIIKEAIKEIKELRAKLKVATEACWEEK